MQSDSFSVILDDCKTKYENKAEKLLTIFKIAYNLFDYKSLKIKFKHDYSTDNTFFYSITG